MSDIPKEEYWKIRDQAHDEFHYLCRKSDINPGWMITHFCTYLLMRIIQQDQRITELEKERNNRGN